MTDIEIIKRIWGVKEREAKLILKALKKRTNTIAKPIIPQKPTRGTRVTIPVAQIEYVEGKNTLWIHGPNGATVLRIKFTGINNVESEVCNTSPVSHADLMVDASLNMCLGKDAEYETR